MSRLNGDGAAWGHLVKVIEEALPETLDDRYRKASTLFGRRSMHSSELKVEDGTRSSMWHPERPTSGKAREAEIERASK